MNKISLFKVYQNPAVLPEIAKCIETGYLGQGIRVEEFEQKLKRHFNNDWMIQVNSGTSAIYLALQLIKEKYELGDNTEVLCSPLNCWAGHAAILMNRLRIKWCDISRDTLNIDLKDLESKLTGNTRIVFLVHFGGNPVDLDHLEYIKQEYLNRYKKPLLIIEDAAHCWNTSIYNKVIGNSGNYVCFSFQAIKFLTTLGDGGLLILPDEETYQQAKLKRWFGLCREKGQSFRCSQNIVELGGKWQPRDTDAVAGLVNLDGANRNVELHRDNALFYNENIRETEHLTKVKTLYGAKNSYWLYNLLVENRQDFIDKMNVNGIEVSQVHHRNDKYDVVQKYQTALPNMDWVTDRHISVPVGWWLTHQDRERIASVINEGC